MASRRPQEGKRFLTPDDAGDAKKRKAVYFTETPGGTMRESDPAHVRRQRSSKPASDLKRPAKKSSGGAPLRSLDPNVPLRMSRQNKDRVAKSHGAQDIEKMSAREILQQGVAAARAREQVHRHGFTLSGRRFSQGQHQVPPEHISSIAGMQRFLDHSMHVDPRLDSTEIDRRLTEANGPSEMKFLEPVGGGTHHMKEGNKNWLRQNRHLKKRLPHVQAAGERIQAALGLVNRYPFSPNPTPPGRLELIMDVEKDKPQQSPTMSTGPSSGGLLSYLEEAGRKYGYRKVDLVCLEIKIIKENVEVICETSNGKFEPIKTVQCEQCPEIKLFAAQGGITLYETNIRQESGPTTTWMWFKITKPLVSMNGNAPPVLATMPESWVIFAIPKLQVETIEEATRSKDTPALGDFAKLSLAAENKATIPPVLKLVFRYSKYGIAKFACSAKPDVFRQKGIVEDFLWVDEASELSEEADETLLDAWWDGLRYRANVDRTRWKNVQNGMARFASLVEARSKRGTGWVNVKGEEAVVVDAGGAEPTMRDSGGTAKKTRTATARQSRLRHEVAYD